MNEEHTMKQREGLKRESTSRTRGASYEPAPAASSPLHSDRRLPTRVVTTALLADWVSLSLTPLGTDLHQSFIPNFVCASSFTLHEKLLRDIQMGQRKHKSYPPDTYTPVSSDCNHYFQRHSYILELINFSHLLDSA